MKNTILSIGYLFYFVTGITVSFFLACDINEEKGVATQQVVDEEILKHYIPDSIEFKSTIEILNPVYAQQLGELLFHKRTGISRVSCNDCHNARNSFFATETLPEGGGSFRRIYNERFKSFFGEDGLKPVDKPNLKSPGILNSAYVTNILWGGELGKGGLNENVPDSLLKSFASFNSESGLESQVNAAQNAHFGSDLALECSHDYLLNKLSLESFGKPIELATVKAAISIFEQGQLTNQNNINKYIRGDSKGLKSYEGLLLYNANCYDCHNKTTVSNKIGISEFEGRFRMTKDSSDYGMVKAPRLENVQDSKGYFHSDEDITLYRAIKRHELGLSRNEIYKIRKFIEKDLYDSRYAE